MATTATKRIAYLEALAMRQGRILKSVIEVFGAHMDANTLRVLKSAVNDAEMIPNAQMARAAESPSNEA